MMKKKASMFDSQPNPPVQLQNSFLGCDSPLVCLLVQGDGDSYTGSTWAWCLQHT